MSPLAPLAAPMESARMESASATRATCWISLGSFVFLTVKEDVELAGSVLHLILANVVKGKSVEIPRNETYFWACRFISFLHTYPREASNMSLFVLLM